MRYLRERRFEIYISREFSSCHIGAIEIFKHENWIFPIFPAASVPYLSFAECVGTQGRYLSRDHLKSCGESRKENHYRFHVTARFRTTISSRCFISEIQRKSSSWICDRHVKWWPVLYSRFPAIFHQMVQVTFLHDHASCGWKVRNRCCLKNQILSVYKALLCWYGAKKILGWHVPHLLLYKYCDLTYQFKNC